MDDSSAVRPDGFPRAWLREITSLGSRFYGQVDWIRKLWPTFVTAFQELFTHLCLSIMPLGGFAGRRTHHSVLPSPWFGYRGMGKRNSTSEAQALNSLENT
jgi:hypothetical protein